jgi:hypothetical protein
VDAVEAVDGDPVGAEALEALLDLRAQLGERRAGVTGLGGDYEVIRERRQGSADRSLALAVGVDVGGVDEVKPRVEPLPEERPAGVRVGEAIRAEADPLDLAVPDRDRAGALCLGVFGLGHGPRLPE